jgi:hypothetical protein
MKSCAELAAQVTPWSVELAFIPRLYVPAELVRQYTMLPEAPPLADSTSAYSFPAVNSYPVENWYVYHVAAAVRLEAKNVVLHKAGPVGLLSDPAA